MKNIIISYLNNKKLLFIALPIAFIPLALIPMEQSNEGLFSLLPKELLEELCLTIAPDTTSYQEAIKTVLYVAIIDKKL